MYGRKSFIEFTLRYYFRQAERDTSNLINGNSENGWYSDKPTRGKRCQGEHQTKVNHEQNVKTKPYKDQFETKLSMSWNINECP